MLIAAGRAKYLEDLCPHDPTISEASIMQDEIKRLGYEGEIKTVGTMKTTEDDIRTILEHAPHYNNVVAIFMAFRIPRAALLMEYLVSKNPAYVDAAKRIAFIPAEQHVPEQLSEFERMTHSRAYRTTVEMERWGIKNLLSGAYGTGGNT